jgi:hypothetical protein
MEIYNNTGDEVVYNVSSSTIDDSGTLDPGETSDDDPAYDNQQNATVTFATTSGNTFGINIPESKEGMTVTVGVYFE